MSITAKLEQGKDEDMKNKDKDMNKGDKDKRERESKAKERERLRQTTKDKGGGGLRTNMRRQRLVKVMHVYKQDLSRLTRMGI